MDLVAELFGLVRAFNAAGVEYAICGGIALAIHGHPRFTQDIDLLVRSADLDRVLRVAASCGFSIQGGRLEFAAGTTQSREIVRVSKSDGQEALTLDLLLAEPSLLSVWNGRTAATWRDETLWVVSRDGLTRMKRLSGRLQDLADIDRIERETEDGRDG